MPRKMRVQYPGAMYHVMSRGDQREDIFLDDADRYDFLKTLAEACLKTDWMVHAFCLMSNHYHLVIETPSANLVAGMAWLQSTYTIRLNHRPAWLRVDRLLGEHGIELDTPVSRQEFERQMERRRLEEVDPEALEAFRRDWCLGSEAFRKQQLERMESGLGQHHAGELRLESAQAKAERLVAEELRRLGWSAQDLVRRPKNDPGKLAIAVRLRRETTLTTKAIAVRVHLGTYNTANARLHRAMKEGSASSDGAQARIGK
jgi:REP element-mobilizing transposase RayT